VKLELVVAGERADESHQKVLTRCGRTGKIGDGKLFVYDGGGCCSYAGMAKRGEAAL